MQSYKLNSCYSDFGESLRTSSRLSLGRFSVRRQILQYRTPSARVAVPGKDALAPWLHLVTCYLLADPIGYDRELQEEFKNANPVFALLRIVGSQMPYSVSPFGQPTLNHCCVPRYSEDLA